MSKVKTKYEEAREDLKLLEPLITDIHEKEAYDGLHTFITSCESVERELEEEKAKREALEKDVNEFINLYLRDVRCENIDRHRFSELKVKLSKVGERK